MRDVKKTTNSLETRRIRKILNEEARLGISPNSESDTEEVDLQKELYPLGHYINNREEMIEQMFSIIKGAKLKKMLPPILKEMPFDELKADCLIHLLGMSKKRIRAILEGREINSSSDSESHSDSSTTPSKKPKVELKPFVVKQEGCSDISDNSEEVVLVDPDLDFLNLTSNDSTKLDATEEKEKSKRKLKRKDLDKKHKRMKTKVVAEASESDEVQQIDSSAESTSENEAETQAPKEGKTLLEILELEMRARAIRALLKNNDPQEGEEPKKTAESLTQNPENSKEKSNKHLKKEDKTKKVTPAKNFRKKKRKNDDVIVITPKVVTIDLTEENEHATSVNNTKGNREENAPSSSQNNNLDGKSQKVSVEDTPQTNIKDDESSMSGKTTVNNEEVLKDKITSETAASCSNETSSKSDSLNKTSQPEHDKSSWAQRWLESKEVKKVVSTSKICGNIRKKIKSAKLAKNQKPIQDESHISSPAPQKVIEGSVVEYELLSKSNSTTVSNVDGVDNDTQVSTLSANQEPLSSEADLTEKSTADQVQDVSSTRAENLSAGLIQDTVSSLQMNEEETLYTNIKSVEHEIGDTVTSKLNVNDQILNTIMSEETGVPSTTDKEVKRSDLKCLSKNDDSIENENICSTEQTNPIILNHDSKNLVENEQIHNNDGNLEMENIGSTMQINQIILNDRCKNIVENKQVEEEHLQFSQENLMDNNFEKVNTRAHNKKSNNTDGCRGSLPNVEIDTKDSKSKPHCLLTDQDITNSSKTSNDNNDEYEFDSDNKNYIESNQENKKSLKIDPKNFENIQKDTNNSERCEMVKNVVSLCSAKHTPEINELETLEINITDEDRDIEDVIEEINEQNQSTISKDSIIVID